MDCPACNQAIETSDRFCKHCGKLLELQEKPSRSQAVDDMEREYRMVLAEHPRDPDAHFNVGLASLYSGNHLAAAEAFRAVTELLPDEPAGYEKLAVALARLDRRAEALEQAAKAARLDPESASIRKLVQALGGQT